MLVENEYIKTTINIEIIFCFLVMSFKKHNVIQTAIHKYIPCERVKVAHNIKKITINRFFIEYLSMISFIKNNRKKDKQNKKNISLCRILACSKYTESSITKEDAVNPIMLEIFFPA